MSVPVFTHVLLDLAGYDLQKRSNKIYLPTVDILHPTRSIHKGRHLNSVSVNLANQMDQIVELGKKKVGHNSNLKKHLRLLLQQKGTY